MAVIVVYGGGFQPFHVGHLSSYLQAKKAFPEAAFYIAASNDTKTRPIPFNDKQFLAQQAGVVDPFVEVKLPIRPHEILDKYNPEKDIFVLIRSERDPVGYTKKDGSPGYYQPFENLESCAPFATHGYVFVTKKQVFKLNGQEVYSGTQVRDMYSNSDDQGKIKIISQLYPKSKQQKMIKKLLDKYLSNTQPMDLPKPNAIKKLKQKQLAETISKIRPLLKEASVEKKLKFLKLMKSSISKSNNSTSTQSEWKKKEQGMEESRIIDPQMVDVYYRPVKDSRGKRIVAKNIPVTALEPLLKKLSEKYAVPVSSFEWTDAQGVKEDIPQPGKSSGKAKQFNPNAKVQTKEMTLDQILSTVKGIPYVNNVVDDWDAKDYSWDVTKKVIEYAQYLQKNPQSVANLPPLVVIDGQLNDGAHRLSAINLLQKRMDSKNPLWKQVKLKVNFGTSEDVAPEQGVAEGATISGDGGAVDNFKQQMANNTEIAYQKGMAEAKKKKKKKSSRSMGGYFFPGYAYFGGGDPGEGSGDGGGESKNRGMAEGTRQQLNIQQLATVSDEALDNAYHYGRSTPGNSFGWQANLKSAAYAKHMIDKGVTDIEAISDAIHKGWNVTAQAFVQNPAQFSDTEKLKAAGKLEAKLQQRAELMKQNYAQLSEEEKEKDRVVARALLQAVRGQQGAAGDLNELANISLPVREDYLPEK